MMHFETDPVARAEHIYSMVGIYPDKRHVPRTETNELIQGVQDGHQDAAQRLIATRLDWMYTKFAPKECVRQRQDLELEDVMQVGCLATMLVAREVQSLSRMSPPTQLYVGIPRKMGLLLMKSKLIPTIAKRGTPQPIYAVDAEGATTLSFNEGIPEPVLPVCDRELEAALCQDRTIVSDSVEHDSSTLRIEALQALSELLAKLTPEKLSTVIMYFNLDNQSDREHGLTLPQIAQKKNMSAEGVRQQLVRGLRELVDAASQDQKETLRSLLDPSVVSYGLAALPAKKPAVPCYEGRQKRGVEAEARQQQWLDEIRRKQQDGELTFVKGALLEERIPDAIWKFISQPTKAYEKEYIPNPHHRLRRLVAEDRLNRLFDEFYAKYARPTVE